MKKLLSLLLIACTLNSYAQDINYTRKALSKLTSKSLWGRGYTKNGMANAAEYLEKEFKSLGLLPMDGKTFRQGFNFDVNTFPGKMELSINDQKLIPGKDFIVAQASIGIKAIGTLTQADSTHFSNSPYKIVVTLQDKLTWSVAQNLKDYTEIFVKKTALSLPPSKISTHIENVFVPQFMAVNICGLVKGTTKPDSVLLITAHYDHLGGMGSKTYFPGANDNASGVSFLLSLAKYYAAHPPQYSIGFICFAGEEAGLLGSKYFTENPIIPLKNIRFLFNIDMVGTGEIGATVVNATLHPQEFALLNKVNELDRLLVKINARGKAANSDHYFFAEKGVPAFFLYTQGGPSAYHDVFDKAETLPFTIYQNLFKLFVGFHTGLMNSAIKN